MQGDSDSELPIDDPSAKVKRFWRSLSPEGRSDILSISLDDIQAKLSDLTDAGEPMICIQRYHCASQGSTILTGEYNHAQEHTASRLCEALCCP